MLNICTHSHLQGHEDLRQDERAMQLFGLVNALLYNDRRTGVNSEDLQVHFIHGSLAQILFVCRMCLHWI